MKVVLLRDVARIGKRYEIKEVPDGHALNMLIPQKIALIATPENMKKVAAIKAKQASDHALHETRFEDALRVLGADGLQIMAQTNAQGHLFKGVHADDIVRAATEKGVALEVGQIDLPHPIKAVGDHNVRLVSSGKEGVVRVTIVAK